MWVVVNLKVIFCAKVTRKLSFRSVILNEQNRQKIDLHHFLRYAVHTHGHVYYNNNNNNNPNLTQFSNLVKLMKGSLINDLLPNLHNIIILILSFEGESPRGGEFNCLISLPVCWNLIGCFAGLRKVYPYYFTFTTFTKGRWVGEKILEVFAREFRAHPAEEYERCIRAGTLTVNYQKVDVDYRLRHNDLLANVVHR